MDPTPRQVAVLAAIVEEGTYVGAGYRLGISPSTVRGHLVDVRRRLGVSTTTQAVYILAMRGQLTCPAIGRAVQSNGLPTADITPHHYTVATCTSGRSARSGLLPARPGIPTP